MRPFAQKRAVSIGNKHKVLFRFLPDVPQFFRGLYRHLLPDKASAHLVVESNASLVPVSGQHTVATSIRFSGTEISE
jgi:hypothetical protein